MNHPVKQGVESQAVRWLGQPSVISTTRWSGLNIPHFDQWAQVSHEGRIEEPTALGGSQWQAKRDSNPQPMVLETTTLPIELLTFGD